MDKVAIEILLVEDNPMDIELTLHALRRENLGNHIVVARDGEEALRLIDQCRADVLQGTALPKLLLLDLKLPKVSGLEVLTYVKADPVTRMIPVVVLTSSRQDEDMVDSYCLGVNSYLQKPVDFEQFRRMAKDLGMYWLIANRMPSLSAVKEKAEVGVPVK